MMLGLEDMFASTTTVVGWAHVLQPRSHNASKKGRCLSALIEVHAPVRLSVQHGCCDGLSLCFRLSLQAQKKKPQKSSGKKKQVHRFTIGCAPKVIDEDILDMVSLEKYLKERIKVNNKLNNLGKEVHIDHESNSVTVTANIPFSKRYLKYLTKKYLKRHKLRDFLRVVSKSKDSYELRFYNFETEDTDNEDED
ncbi:ribosomal L22e protein [Opisthorchis viverrini]|uniref:Large ribosomal subunit protein eL22 n=1 Tax=Opisthorchis viverrini TaxID=6198 RepID=A0A1S8WGG7_OPIVI|nr:ribosomal L22e protein [Opisthorchis viverrini]